MIRLEAKRPFPFRIDVSAGTPAMIRISAFADEISQDPVEQIDVLERLGIKHIEFRAIHGVNVAGLAEAKHREFRSLLHGRGFELSAIGSPIGKIKVTDPFEPHLEKFDHVLHLASFYKTPRIRIFSFYMPPGESPAKHRDEVHSRMKTLVARAADHGVMLLLENEKDLYGDTAPRVLDLIATIDSPFLTHAFDPANYLEVGQSIDDAWTLLRGVVTHFHIKDYDVQSKRNVPAGEGQGQFPRLLREAAAAGYEGFCTLEPHLIEAEKMYGYTGPVRFTDAAHALQIILREAGIAYA